MTDINNMTEPINNELTDAEKNESIIDNTD